MIDERINQIALEADEAISQPKYQRKEEFDISDKLRAIEDRKKRLEKEAREVSTKQDNEFTLGRVPQKEDVARHAAMKRVG